MLVKHGFGYAGRISDLIHRGGVITLGREDLAGCVKQLNASLVPWQAGRSATHRLLLQVGGHKFTLTFEPSVPRWPFGQWADLRSRLLSARSSDVLGQLGGIRREQIGRQVTVVRDSRQHVFG